jgi:Right handed beta helix region
VPEQRQHPVRHLVLVVVLALGALALGAAPALAQPLECGAVVTQDTTLTSDLLDCPGDGLVIGADGITVDLNGHTISGTLISGSNLEQVGIDNSAGHDDVTIRNGTVKFFYHGAIHMVAADRNRIEGMTLDLFHDFGIVLEGGSSGNRLTGNTVTRAGNVGIGLYGAATPSRDNLIAGNATISANTANIALRFGTILGTVIEDNQVDEASDAEHWGGSITVSTGDDNVAGTIVRRNRFDTNFGVALRVGEGAAGTLVERNSLDNSYGHAIVSAGDRTVVRGNTIRSSAFPGSTGFGIQVDPGAEDNRVEVNYIDRAGAIGIDDGGTHTVTTGNVMVGQVYPSELITGVIAGIIVREEASHGRIQANVVRRQAPGFGPDIGAGIQVFGDDMTVVANLVDEIQYRDGIRVEPQASGTQLKANVTTRNGDDGIDVESPATTVTANVASNNADLGIEAVPGVTDGGGNRARGNGNPAQCVRVSCS